MVGKVVTASTPAIIKAGMISVFANLLLFALVPLERDFTSIVVINHNLIQLSIVLCVVTNKVYFHVSSRKLRGV